MEPPGIRSSERQRANGRSGGNRVTGANRIREDASRGRPLQIAKASRMPLPWSSLKKRSAGLPLPRLML